MSFHSARGQPSGRVAFLVLYVRIRFHHVVRIKSSRVLLCFPQVITEYLTHFPRWFDFCVSSPNAASPRCEYHLMNRPWIQDKGWFSSPQTRLVFCDLRNLMWSQLSLLIHCKRKDDPALHDS